jgi:hypothetical protein
LENLATRNIQTEKMSGTWMRVVPGGRSWGQSGPTRAWVSASWTLTLLNLVQQAFTAGIE